VGVVPTAVAEGGEGELVQHRRCGGDEVRCPERPDHRGGRDQPAQAEGRRHGGERLHGARSGQPANPPFHDDPLRSLTSLRGMPALNPTRLHVGHGAPLETERVRRRPTESSARLTRFEAADRIATRADASV
jgi:hypothetical protein